MATIAKLVMEIEAQFKQRGLVDANRAIRTFSKQIDTAFKSIPSLASIASPGGARLLEAQFAATKSAFLRQAEDLRAAFKGRRITADEMFGGVAQAAKQAVEEVKSAAFNLRGFTEKLPGGKERPVLTAQEADAAVQAMEAIGRRTGDALVQGSRAAKAGTKIINNLEREFQAAEATRFITRALGGSTDKQFQQMGRENAAAYDAALAAEMQKLAAKGKLTEPLRQAFSQAFKTQGFGFGDAASAEEKSFARAQRTIEVLQNRLNQTMLRNREKLAQNAISPEAFERKSLEAALAFDRGLATAAGRMRSAGNLGAEAATLINNSFKTIGKRTADQGALAARDYVASFRDTYERAILAARIGSRTGDLTKSQFRAASDDAAKNFAAGIKQVTDRLEREGLLTPQATAFLQRQLSSTGTQAGKTFFEAFDQAMSDSSIKSLSRFGTLASQVGGTLTKFLTVPIAGAGIGAIKLAGDFEQAGKRLQIAFGPAAVSLQRNLNRLQQEIPATSAELRQMAARLGELIVPLGLGAEATAGMAAQLIKITKNISLFAGVDTERSFNAVINGLVGQSRELKKLGVIIDDRSIRDRAYRDGIARVGAQLSETQKVMAGYRVLLDRTRLIEGVLAQSQDTFNVRLLFFTARLKEAGITLGTVVLPFLTRMVTALTSLIEKFSLMSESQKKWLLGLAGAAAVIGPALIALGSLARSIALYRAVLLTLEASGAVAAGGGLLGALGLAGFAAEAAPVVLAIGAITAAVLAYKAATGKASDEMIEFQKEISGMEKSDLEHVRRNLQLSVQRMLQDRATLLQSGQIQAFKTTPPPDLLRGLIDNPFAEVRTAQTAGGDAQRRFEQLGRDIETTKQKIAGVSKEIGGIEQQEAEVNKHAKEFLQLQEQIKKQNATELVVEELQRLTHEYEDLIIKSQAAQASLTKARIIGNPKEIEAATERANGIVSSLKSLQESFNNLSIMPENKSLRHEIDDLATKTKTATDRLEAFLLRASQHKDLNEFAKRVAEIRKEMELGARTGNIEQVEESFRKAAELATEVREKLATAEKAAGQNDVGSRAFITLQASLKTILAELDLMTLKFKGLVPTELFREIDQITAHLKQMKEEAPSTTLTSTGVPLEGMREQQNAVLRLIQLQDDLNKKIAASAAAGFPTDELEKRVRQIGKTVIENTPNMFEVLFGDDFLQRIATVADALRTANFAKQTADAFGDVGASAAAQLRISFAQGMKGKLFEDLQKQIQEFTGLSSADAAKIVAQFQTAFNKATEGAGNFTAGLSKTERRLQNIGLLARGLRSIAEAFNITNNRVGQFITSIGLAIDGLTAFIQKNKEINTDIANRREAAKGAGQTPEQVAAIGATFAQSIERITAAIGVVGAVVGVVSSFVGVIRSLFGKSPIEQEHDRILQENNKRLAEMTLAVTGFTGSIADQLKIVAAAQTRVPRDINPTVVSRILASSGNLFDPKNINDANARLRDFGITFEQIETIAKQNGIQLLDSKGHLVAGAFDQLLKAIELSRAALLKYSETLQDQQKKIELFNNVFNVPDTGQQQITDQLSLLSRLAPDLFKQFFSGVDLGDATKVEAALQALTRALLDGVLQATDTFKLLSRDELEQIITGVADGLDKLREATDSLTESVLNVPEWFKLAQVRFESVAAQIPTMPPTAGTPVGTPETPIANTPSLKPPKIQTKSTETRTVDAERIAASAMVADTLTVARLVAGEVPTMQVDTPSDVTVNAKVQSIPAITVNANVPPIDPVTVRLAVPDTARVQAQIATIPPVVLKLPNEPIVADVRVPPKISLDANITDIPPVVLDLPDKPIVAKVTGIPDQLAVAASIQNIPKVVLDIPQTAIQADVKLPPSIPVTAKIDSLPPVVLDLPDQPIRASVTGIPDTIAVKADVPPIQPITLRLPTEPVVADVKLPQSIPVQATIASIPPVVLDIPTDPIPAKVDVPPSIVLDARVVGDVPPVELKLPADPLTVDVPPIAPIEATVTKLPPVVLALPDDPEITAKVDIPKFADVKAIIASIPPVELRLPSDPIPVDVPKIEPIKVNVANIPPVALKLPQDPIVLQPLTIDTSRLKLTTDGPAIVEPPDRVSLRPPATGASLSPGGDTSVDGSFNVHGPLIGQVVQQPGESTEELAARILGHVRQEKFFRTGTTRIPGIDD